MSAHNESFRRGVRLGAPFAVAGSVMSLSFGVIAVEAGMPAVAAIVMSAIVFAGSAQFAAVAITAAGGSMGAALSAAALMNSRFLPMGIAWAPALPGNALFRALQGHTVVDSSWVQGMRPDGSFDRFVVFGSSGIQYIGWVGGTAVGALLGGSLDAHAWGLDAVFPAFFLALLLPELRDRHEAGVAFAAAVIALALVPVAPAGAPVLAAGAAALWGLRR